MVETSQKFQTVETPNVLGIYLLDCVIKDFLKIGIRTLRKQTDEKAQMLYSFFSKPEYLGSQAKPRTASSAYMTYVKNPKYRSNTTLVFEISGGSESSRKFAAGFGLILGAGYSGFKKKHLRIANFPALSERDIRKLIQVLEKYSKRFLIESLVKLPSQERSHK
ncbi:hypothetical protein HYW44_02580 [Candidatus Daviesbacteria bacterium]|nr:hypothetical protein [Candidatus Daviesbacteria bacterium]